MLENKSAAGVYDQTTRRRGRFMGSGDIRVTGTFWPESKNPNLSLKVASDNTDMGGNEQDFSGLRKI
jgi:hypothetical protein